MSDDQHALSPVVARDGVNHAAKTQDHVAPTLAAGWPVIELAERGAGFSLVRVLLLYADAGQTIKDAELFFAQALVRNETYFLAIYTGRFEREPRRLARANIRRCEHDRRLLFTRQFSESTPERRRLPHPERRERHVNVARRNVYDWKPRSLSRVARHVASALAVSHYPQNIRPFLLFTHYGFPTSS